MRLNIKSHISKLSSDSAYLWLTPKCSPPQKIKNKNKIKINKTVTYDRACRNLATSSSSNEDEDDDDEDDDDDAVETGPRDHGEADGSRPSKIITILKKIVYR